MKIEIFNGNWTLNDVRNNPNKIFVFGDNNARIGKGGQAIIRDLPNVMGIRTKKGPSTKSAAYYKDSEFEQNSKNILEDILEIKKEAMDGMTIVFSNGGYGTGLSSLKNKAPKTFEYLCQQLKDHFNFNNETGKNWYKVPGYQEITSGTYISFDGDPDKKYFILKPTNNSYFKPEYLEDNLNTNFDLIKNGKKVAFSSNLKFESGQIIIFTFNGIKDYLVCSVIDSYDVELVRKDYQWYSFEGYDKSFSIAGPETLINYKYQTHFQFICTLDTSGKMVFKDDIFTDKKKTSSSEHKPTIKEEELRSLDNVQTIYVDEIKEDEVEVVEVNIEEIQKKQDNNTMSDKTVSNEELLEVLKRIEFKLDNKKKGFKNTFRKRTLEELLTKKFGEFFDLKKIDDTRYQLRVVGRFDSSTSNKSIDAYYYVLFNEGIFRNSIDVLLRSNIPMF